MTLKLNAFAVAVVALFAKGAATQMEAAAKVRKLGTREKAKAALLPAVAKKYGGKLSFDDEGNLKGWKSGKGGKCDKPTMAAKAALNRLLALAYGKKKGKARRVTANDKVNRLAAALAKLNAAQFARTVKEAKRIQREE